MQKSNFIQTNDIDFIRTRKIKIKFMTSFLTLQEKFCFFNYDVMKIVHLHEFIPAKFLTFGHPLKFMFSTIMIQHTSPLATNWC